MILVSSRTSVQQKVNTKRKRMSLTVSFAIVPLIFVLLLFGTVKLLFYTGMIVCKNMINNPLLYNAQSASH